MTNLKTSLSTERLLKFRISVYSLALAHLVIMAFRLLNKNFEGSDDPNVRQYSNLKWKLITSWFNLLTLPYIPICIYCDWCTLKQKQEGKYLKILRKIRTYLFTDLIFPVTVFADILFWRLFLLNREYLMPLAIDKILHHWEQHSMHTASLVFVLIDFVMVSRKRPTNMTPGIVRLLIFITLYTSVCVISLLNGEYVYPLFKMFKGHKLVVITVYSYLSVLFYYTSQWIIVDIIHDPKHLTKKLM